MWDRAEGSWKEFTGKVKEQWGKLTDDDLTVIAGKRDQLAGKIQERYGYARDKADEEITAFERRMQEERTFKS
ncbi:MAG: CsbD family protein [Caulobacter sp.]|nr:CsbD family protein [Caulobacter sp.]